LVEVTAVATKEVPETARVHELVEVE